MKKAYKEPSIISALIEILNNIIIHNHIIYKKSDNKNYIKEDQLNYNLNNNYIMHTNRLFEYNKNQNKNLFNNVLDLDPNKKNVDKKLFDYPFGCDYDNNIKKPKKINIGDNNKNFIDIIEPFFSRHYQYIIVKCISNCLDIEMLKNQCFWQETANIFLVCVFVLLIVHRFLTKDY